MAVERTISAAEADLSRVGAFAVGPKGQIALTQPEDHLVKVFHPDGSVSLVGREGGGPGEFRYPVRAGFVGDSLYVVDPQLYRLSLFGSDLRFIRSFSEPRSIYLADGGGQRPTAPIEMNLQALVPGGGMRMTSITRRGAQPPPWAVDEDSGSVQIIRIGQDSVFQAHLATLGPNPCFVRHLAGDRMVLTSIPFCAHPINTGWDGGAMLALVELTSLDPVGASYRVRVVDSDGLMVVGREIGFDPIPIPSAAIDSQRTELDRRREENPERQYPDLDPAPALPPILRALIGIDSTIWLEEEELSPDHTWLVLNQAGETMARVVIPENLILQVASEKRAWLLDEDEIGLQGVVVASLSMALAED